MKWNRDTEGGREAGKEKMLGMCEPMGQVIQVRQLEGDNGVAQPPIASNCQQSMAAPQNENMNVCYYDTVTVSYTLLIDFPP